MWDEEASSKCWLKGPFSYDQLEEMFSGHWTPVRRFGTTQPGNHTEKGTNLAYAACEKIDLRALDHLVWMAGCLSKFMVEKRYELRLSSGEVLRGQVSVEWRQTTV